MQTRLDKSLVENKEYWTQLLTLQDRLSVIQANLNHLHVKRQELEAKYQKVETNWKSLELAVAMDAHELKFTIEPAKCLEKENADLDTKLCS